MSVTRLQAPFPLIWRGFWEDTMHYGMHWPKRQGFRNKAHDEVHVQFLLGLPTSIRNSKLLRILTGFRANFRKSIPWRLGCAYAVGILPRATGRLRLEQCRMLDITSFIEAASYICKEALPQYPHSSQLMHKLLQPRGSAPCMDLLPLLGATVRVAANLATSAPPPENFLACQDTVCHYLCPCIIYCASSRAITEHMLNEEKPSAPNHPSARTTSETVFTNCAASKLNPPSSSGPAMVSS